MPVEMIAWSRHTRRMAYSARSGIREVQQHAGAEHQVVGPDPFRREVVDAAEMAVDARPLAWIANPSAPRWYSAADSGHAVEELAAAPGWRRARSSSAARRSRPSRTRRSNSNAK